MRAVYRFPQQIIEMREALMSIRNDHKAKRANARKVINDQNKMVKEIFEDESSLKDEEEKALSTLLKKGKLNI